MAKCLRCGAGNEWIDHISNQDLIIENKSLVKQRDLLLKKCEEIESIILALKRSLVIAKKGDGE